MTSRIPRVVGLTRSTNAHELPQTVDTEAADPTGRCSALEARALGLLLNAKAGALGRAETFCGSISHGRDGNHKYQPRQP